MVCFFEELCPYLLTWFCSFVFWIPSHSLAPWFSVVVFVLLRKFYFGSLLEWFLFWLGDARQNLTDSTCLSCWGLVAQKINKSNPGMNLNVWNKMLLKHRKKVAGRVRLRPTRNVDSVLKNAHIWGVWGRNNEGSSAEGEEEFQKLFGSYSVQIWSLPRKKVVMQRFIPIVRIL